MRTPAEVVTTKGNGYDLRPVLVDTELAESRKAESDAKHNLEMLKQSLSDQLDADNKDLDSEKTDKAAAEEDKELVATVETLQVVRSRLSKRR